MTYFAIFIHPSYILQSKQKHLKSSIEDSLIAA